VGTGRAAATDALAVIGAVPYVARTMSENFRAYCKVGERIASLAKNQTELARVLGLCQQTISTKLRGDSAILVSDLERLARHYGVPTTFFVEEPDELPKPVGYRDFADMSPEAREVVLLVSGLPEDSVRNILAMAQLLVENTGKTRKPTRSSVSD
jgi:transcriptional regulator with XRE-family HTH domain